MRNPMGHAGPQTNQRTDSNRGQNRGDEDSERQPSLIPRHSGHGISQPLQRAKRRQAGLESVERFAGLIGIFLKFAGDLAKE